MKNQIWLRGVGCGLLIAVLSACGGGGSSAPASTPTPPTPPAPATSSFALAAGYKARVMSGVTDNFDLSGDCTGTATIAYAAAMPATFEAVTGLSASQTATANLANCLPASSSVTGLTYYDANGVPIGQSINGGDYAKYETLPLALPASVKVGDTADVVALATYTDSTKATQTGRRVYSYLIEPDTATTAIANISIRTYNTTAQLLSTQQSRYRMLADGTLKLVSIDVQFRLTSNTHLVYTAR
jgi:hypothetical protein